MTDLAGQTWWLVGASEGLGAALARKMSAAGATLVLSARSTDKLTELADSLPGPARGVACDVTDSASVRQAYAEAGEIDGIVILAGAYWPVNAKDWQAEHVETMIDVNLTGMARVLGAVVPDFVARDRGRIVLTGSLSAYVGLPGAIGYSTSKAGVQGLAESMAVDLHGTGVTVQLANPGFIKTRLTDKNAFKMYQIMEPDEAAGHMMRLIGSNRFSLAFPNPFALVFRGARFLPQKLLNRLFA
ncbi:SDR family NAD(P)-dependent oxidoreductase [Mesobacterium pallidum]|uniref:SDR family NAD(P)-dependent oxidoreductase n=1 Tax=Mesobacterium pallidum TaxID=2872037 RepID=UPI001EE2F79D|nr:SDR family NAD(P)-dependent oxidoreductase [Mesobacterium pallidum]